MAKKTDRASRQHKSHWGRRLAKVSYKLTRGIFRGGRKAAGHRRSRQR